MKLSTFLSVVALCTPLPFASAVTKRVTFELKCDKGSPSDKDLPYYLDCVEFGFNFTAASYGSRLDSETSTDIKAKSDDSHLYVTLVTEKKVEAGAGGQVGSRLLRTGASTKRRLQGGNNNMDDDDPIPDPWRRLSEEEWTDEEDEDEEEWTQGNLRALQGGNNNMDDDDPIPDPWRRLTEEEEVEEAEAEEELARSLGLMVTSVSRSEW
eukprot:CAMPEP_0118711292 /NCGR_PEP_ID=MMETSP0800-20121206/23989_1 /TAXON_ID=210618 ORGANISM="Striatella unipunctata, Strain CCMP2910" /NCGR_SAMPLE_ID=MMETSP0800 /ASSEMBLY_ACC=CAM_ASM_000638 /LENGTH=209 /DNA_ID=CAMNT_0006615835 /DNA_START=18 /DNA_END=644 /DNA_ORIENTATION=-